MTTKEKHAIEYSKTQARRIIAQLEEDLGAVDSARLVGKLLDFIRLCDTTLREPE